MAVAIALTLVFGITAATAAVTGGNVAGLVYASDASMTTAASLSKATIHGVVYVDVVNAPTIVSAQTYLDDPNGTGQPMPRSNSLNTTTLTNGPHTLLVVITSNAGGATSDMFARFTVSNAAAPVTPTTVAPSPT